MVLIAVAVLCAGLGGLVLGYVVSKRAVEWCPTCGRSLEGHCPEGSPLDANRQPLAARFAHRFAP